MSKTPPMNAMSRTKRALLGALLGLAVGALLLGLRGTGFVARGEEALVDSRTRMFAEDRAPDPRIVLAIVDDNEAARMSQAWQIDTWPWNQDVQAAAIDFLTRAKAQALVLDFVYVDRGKDLDERGADMSEVNEANAQTQLDQARVYGEALGRFGKGIVGMSLDDAPDWDTPQRRALLPGRTLPADTRLAQATPLDRDGIELPVPAILAGAHTVGYVTVLPDGDGIVRRYWPRAHGGEQAHLSLAAAVTRVLPEGESSVDAQAVDAEGGFILNFSDLSAGAYERVSPFEMIKGEFYLQDPEANWSETDDPTGLEDARALLASLEGKIVIWGASLTGQPDIRPTPMGTSTLGPLVHATALDNLLHADGRVRVAGWLQALILLVGLALLGAYGGASRGRIAPHLLAVAGGALYVLLALWLFAQGSVLDLFVPLLGGLLVWAFGSAARFLTEGRRNRWLESTFGRYLSPDVIEALKQDPDKLRLGGQRKELTIFFSDVAGFTSIAEQLQAEQVVELLNRHLTLESRAVMHEGGVIDKFQGDAVMAFFGDPLDTPDHALRACRTALRCIAALEELRGMQAELGLDRLDVRIGLNTGTALVGNMGSLDRFDYTCMGDSVNLASRLEGANKVFGSRILIGPRLREQAGDAILARPLADLVVVGKVEAVPVYELVSLTEDASEAQRVHVAAFVRAREALMAGDLEAAAQAMDEAEAAQPRQGPVAWLRQVRAQMEAGRRPTPWDGREVLTRK